MKKLFVTFIAATYIGAVSASDDAENWCSQIGGISKAVMDLRQTGFSLDEVLKITKKSSGDNPELKRLSGNIVKLAYHESLFHGDELKMAAIVEFQNKQQLNCLNAND